MDITYKSIEHYIVSQEQIGSNMICKFHIENQDFEAEVAIDATNNSSGALVADIVKSSRMRSILVRVLKKAVGNKSKKEKTDGDSIQFSKREKEAAVINAFRSITSQLFFVETTGKWRLATEFSEFERRIKQNSLTGLYDKKIMSRMLVEMARADGRIEENERLFFDNFLNEETGRLSDLMRAPYLSTEDCQKVSNKAKAIIFMIVAAVALTDNHFDKIEQDKLNDFAKMFNFEQKKQLDLLRIAQDYTVQVAIKAQTKKLSKEELHAFADKIGMDKSAAEKTQLRLGL
jgi:hypothetical protein